MSFLSLGLTHFYDAGRRFSFPSIGLCLQKIHAVCRWQHPLLRSTDELVASGNTFHTNPSFSAQFLGPFPLRRTGRCRWVDCFFNASRTCCWRFPSFSSSNFRCCSSTFLCRKSKQNAFAVCEPPVCKTACMRSPTFCSSPRRLLRISRT